MKRTVQFCAAFALALFLGLLGALFSPVFAEFPAQDEGEAPAAPVCEVTGEHVFGAFAPAAAGTHEGVCALCGQTFSFPCVYEETAVLPTQSAPGGVRRVCTLCGAETFEQTLPPEGEREGSLPLGDADRDGKVTSADARLILRAAISLEALPDESLPLSDMDRDGRVASADARLALRACVGLDAASERHDFITRTDLPATCTREGKLTYACAYCAETGEVTAPTLPHAFGAPEITPATCTQAGKRTRVCQSCGAKSIESLPKVGHDFRFSGGRLLCKVCGEKANGLVSVENSTFCAMKGAVETSWTEVDGDYYFFDRNTGVMQKNTVVDGIRLDGEGKAAANAVLREKIRTFIKAKKILREITDPGDSAETKRWKAFRWVASFPYHQYRQVGVAMETPGFESLFANDIFDRHDGCCGSTSYAFAFLAVEAGWHDVLVVDDGVRNGGHAWVAMEGTRRVYDVIFAEAYGYSKNYDVVPDDYRSYHPRETYVGG